MSRDETREIRDETREIPDETAVVMLRFRRGRTKVRSALLLYIFLTYEHSYGLNIASRVAEAVVVLRVVWGLGFTSSYDPTLVRARTKLRTGRVWG